MKLAMIGGNGHHVLAHLAGKDPNLQLVGVAPDGHDNAAESYRKHPAFGAYSQYFENYEKMLDTVKPDIVSVGAQYAFNGSINRALLERGIPVVSEKPVANSLEELAELDRLVREKNVCLVAELTMRWSPAYAAARKAIQEGRIGEVTLITAQKSYRFGSRPEFYKRRATYGGTILWVAVHAIDFASWCTGLDYASVYGVQGNISRPEYGEMEDHVALAFEMKNGASCIVHADYLRPAKAPTHGDDRLRVMGTQGYIEVKDDECTICTHETEEEIIVPEAVDVHDAGRALLASALGKSDAMTWENTRRITEVCLKARDAADEKRVVSLA